MNKKILVVVDVQNDFIDGSLHNDEAINKIPNIVKKINEFNGDYIFVTRDTHDYDYMTTNEGKYLPVAHCIKNTDGWYINPEVLAALHKKELQDDACIIQYIDKPTFGSYDLVTCIKNIDGDLDIEFVGFCTDICVVSNVLLVKAAVYDRATIVVDSDCCAGVTVESHEAALTTMRMCQVNII